MDTDQVRTPTFAAASAQHLLSAAGSLVVLVRSRGGVLVASDSRVNDTFSRTTYDGVRKLDAEGPFAWFLTGKARFVAFDADTRKVCAQLDLLHLLTSTGCSQDATSAIEMATKMAIQAADQLAQLCGDYRTPVGQPLADLATIGVVHRADELALIRLRVAQDRWGVECVAIPVAQIPRVGVFGNDRVYNAIKRAESGFELYREHPVFRKVWDSQKDPRQGEAEEFARWLIAVTSEMDCLLGPTEHPVGGAPAIVFMSAVGSTWLANPGNPDTGF